MTSAIPSVSRPTGTDESRPTEQARKLLKDERGEALEGAEEAAIVVSGVEADGNKLASAYSVRELEGMLQSWDAPNQKQVILLRETFYSILRSKYWHM